MAAHRGLIDNDQVPPLRPVAYQCLQLSYKGHLLFGFSLPVAQPTHADARLVQQMPYRSRRYAVPTRVYRKWRTSLVVHQFM